MPHTRVSADRAAKPRRRTDAGALHRILTTLVAMSFLLGSGVPAFAAPAKQVTESPTETPSETATDTPTVVPSIEPTASSTASDTPFPTQTDTAQPSASATASVTTTLEATSTPTPSETPSPSPSPTATAPFAFTVGLLASPPSVRRGEGIALHWEISANGLPGQVDLPQDAVLEILFPAGFHLAREDKDLAEGDALDITSSTLRLSLDRPRGQVRWIVAPEAIGPFTFTATLLVADLVSGEGALAIEDERFVPVSADGGEASDETGRLRVVFPSYAVDQSLRVWIRPLQAASAPPYTLSGQPYEIVAEQEATQAESSAEPAAPTEEVQETATVTPEETSGAAAPEGAAATAAPEPPEPSATPAATVLAGTSSDVPPTDAATIAQPPTLEDTPTPSPTSEDAEPTPQAPVSAEGREFEAPITIEVHYDESRIDGDERSLILFYFDETLGTWVPLPSTVDIENNLLSAQTDHLSIFDMTAQNLEVARLPDLKAFQTSLFTGAASYFYPLWVPTGPGGLQPDLALSYSSQTVDSASSTTQASWVGMGWDLSTGSIVRDTHGTIDFPGDDTYSISAGGVSSMLLPGADGYWHTADESFWRISYDSGNNKWTALDGSGTTYVFGETAAARATYPECTSPDNVTGRTWNWSLSSVANSFDRSLTYTYAKETKNVSSFCGSSTATMDVAIYPDTIVYPHSRYRVSFVRAADRLDYLVQWEGDASRVRFMKSRLTSVRVERDADGNGSFETPIRGYDLSYELDASKRVGRGVDWVYQCNPNCSSFEGDLTLINIQEFGVGGSSSLPAVRFGYSGNHLSWAENGYGGRVEFSYERWEDSSGPQKEDQTCQDLAFTGWSYALCNNNSASGRLYIYSGQSLSANDSLVRVFQPGASYRLQATAYGCTGCSATLKLGIHDGVTAQYLNQVSLPDDGTPVSIDGTITISANARQAQLLLSGSNWSLSEYHVTLLMTRYRVSEKRLYDGVDEDARIFSYTYSGPASNDTTHSEAAGEPEATRYSETYSEFRGHAQVDETGPEGRVTRTYFKQDDQLKGKAYQVEPRKYGVSQAYVETETTFQTEEQAAARSDLTVFPHNSQGAGYTDLGIWWTYPSRTEVRTYEGDTDYVARRTDFQHLPEDQGGTQYGNRTRSVDSSLDGGDWVEYRSTRTLYYPSDSGSTYLVSLPASQEQFGCEAAGSCSLSSGQLLGLTLYLYDGASDFEAAPTAGHPTGQRVWADGNGSGQRFQDTSYGYDSWGNQDEQTVCTAYGYLSPPASSGCQTTSTEFDTTYHTYALSESNAEGHETTWEYNLNLGAPTEEEDPNGAVTTATHDDFGRLTSIRRPGDESGNATLSVSYHDSASPYWVEIRQRTSGSSTFTLRNIYDGLGQRVQVQTAGATIGIDTKDIIVDTVFNAYGVVVSQSIPYGVSPWSGSGNPYRTPDTSQPTTDTTYDSLGRLLVVTATDGTHRTFQHDDLTTSVTDALSHTTTTTLDVWGRSRIVDPPDTEPSAVYVYNELDQLTAATMGTGTVTLYYDNAGRKTSIQDPDMGDWTYEYDALGNLIEQTDARGCAIHFTYDSLNRVTHKSYTTLGSCAATADVTFSYDSTSGGNNGIGQRTGMADASGSTSWKFDERGRLVTETGTIDGAGTYVTQWGYNSADQVLWMRYPGGSNGETGETVTYDYLPQQALESITSNLGTSYIENITYDASGRPDITKYSDGAFQTDRNYFAWTDSPGQGRLQQFLSGTTGDTDSLQDLRYEYDAVGNIRYIRDYRAGSPQTQAFTYDEVDRIKTASATGGTDGTYSETYDYASSTGNLSLKGEGQGVALTYEDTDHIHAVTHVGSTEQYRYDEDGNQNWRSIDGTTQLLYYDGENRLVEVTQGGNTIAQFVYDGDGELIREVSDGKTTIYVGKHLELVLTSTPGPTATPTASRTPSATAPSATPSATPTPSATRTATPTRTNTPAPPSTLTATYSPTPTTGTGLTGEYRDADTVLIRTDATVNFAWGTNSPDEPLDRIGNNNFTVRWTGFVRPEFSETYTFYVNHDDGAKLWVNNQLIVNQWGTTGEHSGTIALTAGVKYGIRLEYFENSYMATAKLSWDSPTIPAKEIIPQSRLYPAPVEPPPSGSGTGLRGEYYNGDNFTTFKLARIDPTVNFSWPGGNPPDPSMDGNHFSVRWTGSVEPKYTELYTLYVYHDDGAKLWVNDQLLVNQWGTSGAEHSGTITLNAGVRYTIKLEFYDNAYDATVRLYWSSPSQSKEIIPQSQLYAVPPGGTATPTATATSTATSTNTPTPTQTATQYSGVAVSSIVTTGTWDASTIDFSHTVENGADRLLVLTMLRPADSNPSTMTFDGQPMTNLAGRCDNGADYICAQMYYLVNPPVGTFNVHLSFGTGGKIIAGVMTLYGIDQANPVIGYGTDFNYNGSSVPSVDLSSQPGDIALDVLVGLDCGSFGPGAGQTERWDVAMTNPNWVRRAATSSEVATSSSVNMSYSGASGTGCNWAYVAALFREAAWPTTTPTPTLTPTFTPTITPTPTPTVPAAPSGQVWRSYYFAGSQRFAMRVAGDSDPDNNGVFYLLGDHLGSTSVLVDADGLSVSEQMYKPWGEMRSSSGITETDYRYTGQREESAFGLYYYGARWYDTTTGRFVNPDQYMPPKPDPQALDRYAYVHNNPLRYSDPSGHYVCEDEPCRPPSIPRFVAPISRFSERTRTKGYSLKGNHPGIDLSAADVTIVASGTGTVIISDPCEALDCVGSGESGANEDRTSAAYNGGYGNVVLIEYAFRNLPPRVQHDPDLVEAGFGPGMSLFVLTAHMKDPSSLRPGDRVNPGDVIGKVGSTGNSEGNHLHLETRIGETGSLAYGDMCASVCYEDAGSPDARFAKWYGNPPKGNPMHFMPINPDLIQFAP